MGQHTISEAAQLLEDLAPSLNQRQLSALEEELAEVTTATQQRATTYLETRAGELQNDQNAYTEELCRVRDELTALADEGALGRLSAREYDERLRALLARQRRYERLATQADQRIAALEELHADPVGWFDQRIHARYPNVRPTFSW